MTVILLNCLIIYYRKITRLKYLLRLRNSLVATIFLVRLCRKLSDVILQK